MTQTRTQTEIPGYIGATGDASYLVYQGETIIGRVEADCYACAWAKALALSQPGFRLAFDIGTLDGKLPCQMEVNRQRRANRRRGNVN